ncbi:protein YkfC-like [Euwallacea similis]|uniref:protein YkfC-like n=1 Tax=Euwallacea similis TaxID=1736056 RepID=UPI0034509A3A
MNQLKIRYRWNEIPWRQLEKSSFKLQKRIYRASQNNDIKSVHRLQKLLLRSKSGKFMSVRRVTQDNQGRKTAGIDGISDLNQEQRLDLVESLSLNEKSKPVRRIWISKRGKTEKRPLGIPTIADRAKQALMKMALEPEWEAKFEPNSYGFRPGRSCHDVYEAIFEALKRKTAFVLDADISGCFDNINHSVLLKKLNTTPTIQRIIKGWLKAGMMENSLFYATERGTPQGGIISPLLANVALHGLEYDTKQALSKDLFQYKKEKSGKASYINTQKMMSIIRYADDCVVLHESKDIVLKAKSFVEEWLKKIGLELNSSKTCITHTLKSSGNNQIGFDFLGYTVRQFPVNHSKKGYKLLIKPSRKAQKRHAQVIQEKLKSMRGLTQAAVINCLNPIIKGWSRYYIPGVSRKVFERMDHDMHYKLWKWALYRHPHKGKGWVRRKYFRKHGNDIWRFKTHKEEILVRHSDFHIKRYTKVSGVKSPYDGDMVYWARRLGRSPTMPPRVVKLLKVQRGKCELCQLWFRSGDLMEVHHRDQQRSNNRNENLVLLHRHCHDDIHRASCI